MCGVTFYFFHPNYTRPRVNSEISTPKTLFNFIKEIGYSSLLAFILFAGYLRKVLSENNSLTALILLGSSLAIFWEFSSRSTLFSNTVLFLLYTNYVLNMEFSINKQFWVTAIITGLLLSTRTLYFLPFITLLVYKYQQDKTTLKPLFIWAATGASVFALTFAPLLFYFYHDFVIRNPFMVQSNQLLPFSIGSIFIITAVLIGLLPKHKILFYSGINLLALFIVYSGYTILRCNSFSDAFIGSKADISYAIFAIPFVLCGDYSYPVYSNK